MPRPFIPYLLLTSAALPKEVCIRLQSMEAKASYLALFILSQHLGCMRGRHACSPAQQGTKVQGRGTWLPSQQS